MFLVFVFFFKHKTAYEVRISDWSSDVCSSDLSLPMAGNSFGETFRFTTWGESHGSAIGCVVDGVPPRVALTAADLQHWLDRRKPGQSRFTTQRREPDTVKKIGRAHV